MQVVARAGLRAFEFWDWRPYDVQALAESAAANGLHAVIFSGNTFAEPLVDPTRQSEAMAHLRRSLEVASRFGTKLQVIHVGYMHPQRSRVEQWRAAVRGLRAAAVMAQAAGVTLTVEPLNSSRDHPGYFLDSLPDALRLVDEVDHSAVRLLLDLYHMRLMHEDLLDRLPEVLAKTVHIHVADVPGRGEPGSGAIPWRDVMGLIRDSGYQGTIGLECWPTTTPEEALRRSVEVLGA